jgi:peptidoglycan/LPS O-acetylase OafA/YrhL
MLLQSRTTGAGTRPGRSLGSGATSASPEVRLSYSPGLDGLRAIAVMAVLLYHADLSFIPGGFLGVEVFFVISGYLITALLLAEFHHKGHISLKEFWLRRARRLLPALYVLLVVTLAYCVVFLPGEVAGLRADAIAAVGYVTNWFLILGQESYFESVGRPSVLQHLWSLAVEEQFYLIWPIVLAVGLGVGTTYRRRKLILTVALTGAAASAVAMALMYTPGVDPSRVYFGTDTRATGLLCGAALAFLWSPADKYHPAETRQERLKLPDRGRLRRRWGWTAPLLLDVLCIAALGGLIWFFLHLGEFEPLLYRGGFALVGLTTVAAIMAAVHPYAHVGSYVLGSAPMRWIGVRSYGIYLWHWPVFMVTRPELDVPLDGVPLLALRLSITIVLADLSYRFVETPIRRGALGRAWKALRGARGERRRRLRLQWAGAVMPAMALCIVLGVAAALAEPPKPPSYVSTKHVRIETAGRGETQKAQGNAGTSEEAASDTAAPSRKAGARHARTGARRRAALRGGGTDDRRGAALRDQVTAIGDSVMLGAVDALQQDIPRLTTIDARGSRQIPEATHVLKHLSASGKLGKVVIFHIGDNGAVTDEEFDDVMNVLSDTRKVLVVNTTVPDGYQWAPNNKVLADGVARYPDKAVLVDWHARSAGHPEYFYDGLHLTPSGARAYAGLIAATYRAQVIQPSALSQKADR